MDRQGNYIGQHVFVVTICVVFLVVLAMVLFIPSQRRIQALESRISRTQAKIEEQKVLNPLYTQLMAERARLQQRNMPEPVTVSFSEQSISKIWDIFGEKARESGLQTVSIQPVSESVSDRLQINAVFSGPLPAFREFLLKLGALTFVTHVEQVLIQEVVGGREYRLKIWLTIG